MHSRPLKDTTVVRASAEYKLLLSSHECCLLIERIPQNLSHLWLYGVGCVSGDYVSSGYVGDGSVQSGERCLILSWLKVPDVVCLSYPGSLLLMIIYTVPDMP